LNSSNSQNSLKIIIVKSEFNNRITDSLVKGAENAFLSMGGLALNLKVYKVPGAFEIPGAINQIIKNCKFDAIIAIGAVIRGETPHFDFIASESANGIAKISMESDFPVINGIITTDNLKQAEDRAESDGKNKGWEAMESALKTIEAYQKIHSA
tara:strand:- start:796 stop:1257 length:462 start_codon:yes stop_codon:yes gene_type:complete